MYAFVTNCLVFLLVWGATEGYNNYQLTDCTGYRSNRLLTMEGSTVDYPISITGDVRLTGTINLHRPILGNLRLSYEVEQWWWWSYRSVRSGSVDVCEKLSENEGDCAWQLERMNIPCRCSFNNGTYTIQPYAFNVPSRCRYCYGDFRTTARLHDQATGEEVNCYQVEFTIPY